MPSRPAERIRRSLNTIQGLAIFYLKSFGESDTRHGLRHLFGGMLTEKDCSVNTRQYPHPESLLPGLPSQLWSNPTIRSLLVPTLLHLHPSSTTREASGDAHPSPVLLLPLPLLSLSFTHNPSHPQPASLGGCTFLTPTLTLLPLLLSILSAARLGG